MSTPIDGTTYPFDPTGKLASNLIAAEMQILTAQNYRDYHFIVPNAAPYFVNSLVITFKDTQGNVRPLTEGVDYVCTHMFHDASLACAAPIAGSISFYNTLLAGQVQLKYQTLGGIWTLDADAIAKILADRLHNPRITTWEQVTDQPVTFPVIDHEWNLVDLVGMSEVVTAINEIADMLRQTGSTGLAAHLADFNNPHRTTAAQVGLGNVPNFAKATQADAQAGVRDDLLMTPAMVAAAISVLPAGGLSAHLADHSNPHVVTATQVGLGNVQNYGIASTADAQAGTRDDLYMTPLKTAAYVSNGIVQQLAAHENDYTNPHRVNAGQVGAYSKAEVDAALNNKLGTTAQAADSAKFGGQTPAQFTASVLAGKAATAGTADTATNALAVYGLDQTTLTQQILSGTAANATKAFGLSQPDLTSAILAGTAANSTLFSGLTVQQLIDMVNSSSPAGAQQSIQPQDQTVATNLWTKLGYIHLPSTSSGDPATRLPDAQMIVSGGDSYNDQQSGLYLLTLTARTTQPTLTVLNMTGTAVNVQFGWRNGTDDNGVATVEIWAKTAGQMNFIVSTELNQTGLTFTGSSGSVSTEPTGMNYSVEDGFARVSDVVTAFTSLTNAFNELQASLN